MVQYSVCLQEVWKETNNHIGPQRKKVNLLPKAVQTDIPPFSCEWTRGTGRPRERERESESSKISSHGSNDNKQITQERRSLWSFPVRMSAFSFFPALVLFFPSFFYPLPPLPPLLPETCFQHAKPCKNRLQVFNLGPVCKDVPACYAVPCYCCLGAPCLILSYKHANLIKSPTQWERAEHPASGYYRITQ